MKKTLDTRICEVTVYDEQALVTRRGVVQLTGEEHEVVIAQLPATLVSESVRARSVGTNPMRLMGVRTERICSTGAVAQKVEQLTQEIGKLEEQKRQGQDLLALLNLQRNFVKSLSTQYLERWTKCQTPEPINLNQIRELLEFVEKYYREYSQAIAQQDQEQKQLDKQLQALRQELNQLSTSNPSESFNIIITLEPELRAGEIELEVSYIVHQASWVPLYDLRWDSTSEKISISYLAKVKQNSGEDWLDVALTLSNTKPGLGMLPPKLVPWHIDVQNSTSPGVKGSASLSSRVIYTMPYAGMSPASEGVTNAEVDNTLAQKSTAQACQPGGRVTVKVSSKCNIESDGAAHQTTIFTKDYPCRAQYIAIPRLVNSAYLQIAIANPLRGITLLPGKANIFHGNTFVGTTQLEKISPGQEVSLNLGMDEGLKIERDLVERQVDERVDNLQLTTYAYRILITNLHECSLQLSLLEQLPVTRNEQIKVHLTCSNPQVEIGEMGQLEWSLTLLPLSKQELYYQFTVEHPPELTVVGLDM